MADIGAFYHAQAEACARDAAEALLDNVRDRSLRAESAWRILADRHLRAERLRASLVAAKIGEGAA